MTQLPLCKSMLAFSKPPSSSSLTCNNVLSAHWCYTQCQPLYQAQLTSHFCDRDVTFGEKENSSDHPQALLNPLAEARMSDSI